MHKIQMTHGLVRFEIEFLRILSDVYLLKVPKLKKLQSTNGFK